MISPGAVGGLLCFYCLTHRNNRSLAFTYDQLNRLQTAGTVSGAGTPWSTTYSYDNWGNLLQKASTSTAGEQPINVTANVQNHINPQSYTYDLAGNLTFDGADYLTFDAENRVNPVSGLHYYYDGDDHRVAKSDGSRYWYDDGFNVISMADGSNTLKRDFVYFNGQRLGWVSVSSGDPHYNLSDHLGSPHVVANGDGSVVSWEEDYFPFGGVQPISNADGLTVNYQFTSYEYDFELHDNYANFREQSPVLGRFFSPDRLGGDLANPQSLNRYAYALNNPVNITDPLGLCGTDDTNSTDEFANCGNGYSSDGSFCPPNTICTTNAPLKPETPPNPSGPPPFNYSFGPIQTGSWGSTGGSGGGAHVSVGPPQNSSQPADNNPKGKRDCLLASAIVAAADFVGVEGFIDPSDPEGVLVDFAKSGRELLENGAVQASIVRTATKAATTAGIDVSERVIFRTVAEGVPVLGEFVLAWQGIHAAKAGIKYFKEAVDKGQCVGE